MITSQTIERAEPNRTPNYLNAKRHPRKHILLKLSKVNDKEFSGQPEEKGLYPTKETPLGYYQIFQQKPYKPGESRIKY